MKKKSSFANHAFAALTIQKAFREYSTKKRLQQEKDELPDLNSKDVQDAAAKIQAAFKGFKVRTEAKSKSEDLPDLNDRDVQDAALKIQAAFKGFKVRTEAKSKNDVLPDLNDRDVQDAAVKIQAAFKGFKVRTDAKSRHEDLPDLNDRDLQDAAIKIQAAFKGFKVRTEAKSKNDDLPDLNDMDVQDAAIKIQAAFKGFKVRSTKKDIKQEQESLPDLNDKDLVEAAIKIQAAFKGFKVRNNQLTNEELPDLNDKDLADAAIKIQAAFKGFKVRSSNKNVMHESLPDLNDKEVQDAAVKIQSVFKGFKVRSENDKQKLKDLPDPEAKEVLNAAVMTQKSSNGYSERRDMNNIQVKRKDDIEEEEKDELPDLLDEETLAAALKIQSAFKGYKVRSVHKVPMTPQPSIDFENIPPSDFANFSSTSSKRAPPVPTRFDSRKMPESKSVTSSNVPNLTDTQIINKSPQHIYSQKLKEVSIPKVPNVGDDSDKSLSSQSSTAPLNSEPVGFFQQTLMRKESLQNFFKKQTEAVSSPETPEKERFHESPMSKNFKEVSETVQAKNKSLSNKSKEEQKSKIGGFFSSMFKKADKPKEPSPTKEVISPELKEITNVEFKFDDKTEEPKSQKVVRAISSSDTESGGSPVNISRESSREDLNNKEGKQNKDNVDASKSSSNKSKSTLNDATTKVQKPVKKIEVTNGSADEDLKKDLIHVVLTAVEENWLNQAPKPTLDKVKAMQAQDSDPELENSERSTSEADYMKKKTRAQKSTDLQSDDEGAQLFKQESADGEFPYIETTLPQEKGGIVTITPSNQRVAECRLTSIDRPRSLSPRKPGKLEDFVQDTGKPGLEREDSKSKITVKLPRQESKGKLIKPKQENGSFDKFSAAGLHSLQQVRKVASNPIQKTSAIEAKSKKNWVDCDKLPEKKKSIKKYSTDPKKRRSTDGSDSSIQTLSGTQIVSPEDCSCDCHHDSPPHSHSTAARDNCRHIGTKPKTNPRTSSVTARTKPIPSLKSKDSTGQLKTAGTKPSLTAKKANAPPPVPVRTTSVSKSTKPR